MCWGITRCIITNLPVSQTIPVYTAPLLLRLLPAGSFSSAPTSALVLTGEKTLSITNSINTFFKQLKLSLMKKFLFTITVIFAGAVCLQAQNSVATDPNNKFVSAMEKNIQVLDTASSP